MSDERPLVFRRYSQGFQPTDDASEAALRSVKLGECVEIKLKRPRNLRQLRLYWKLMETVFNNQEHFKTPEEVSDAFKFSCGHYDTFRTRSGEYHKPKSISFAAMDQIAFGEYFKRAVDFCCAEVIPGMNSETLEREVMELVGA